MQVINIVYWLLMAINEILIYRDIIVSSNSHVNPSINISYIIYFFLQYANNVKFTLPIIIKFKYIYIFYVELYAKLDKLWRYYIFNKFLRQCI